MGFRFRKSINIGGFKINFSKKGIGYSVGVPGMRYTKKADGGLRVTANIPGSGISYQKDLRAMDKNKIAYKADENNIHDEQYEKNYIYDENKQKLIKNINRAYKKGNNKNLKVVLIILGAIFFLVGFQYWPSMIMSIACFAISIWLSIGICVNLNYDFNENIVFEHGYKDLKKSIEQLLNCGTVYQTEVLNYNENKQVYYNNILDVNYMELKEEVQYINSNIELNILSMDDKEILFLPDMILIRKEDKFFEFSYQGINTECNNIRFSEGEVVPNDAEVIEYCWEHTNKDGGKDMRYANNKKIAICIYSVIDISLSSQSKLRFVVSDNQKAINFAKNLQKYINNIKTSLN